APAVAHRADLRRLQHPLEQLALGRRGARLGDATPPEIGLAARPCAHEDVAQVVLDAPDDLRGDDDAAHGYRTSTSTNLPELSRSTRGPAALRPVLSDDTVWSSTKKQSLPRFAATTGAVVSLFHQMTSNFRWKMTSIIFVPF